MLVPDSPGTASARRLDGAPFRFSRVENLFWLLLVPAIPVAVAVLVHGHALLDRPHFTSRPEAFIVEGAERVAQGRALYGPLGELPFVIHVYNPLVYCVPGGIGAALDLDQVGILRIGRYVSYGSTLLLAGVLAGIVGLLTRCARAAVLAAVAPFLFHDVLLSDFHRLRPEMPGLLLTFVGVGAVLVRRRWSVPVAAGAYILAFEFKQSFVAAPVATLAYLGATRPRDALRFGAIMTGLLMLHFATMAAWSGRAYFDDAFRALASNEVHPARMFGRMRPELWRTEWGLALAALPALLIVARTPRLSFLLVYIAVVLAWTLYSAGKDGADTNYWSQVSAAVLLMVTLATALPTGVPVARLAVIACLAAFSWTAASDLSPSGLRLYFQKPSHFDEAVAAIRTHEGPRLITDEGVAVRVGDVEVLDWFLISRLEVEGVLDPAPLFQRIRDGHYALIAVAVRPRSALNRRVLTATLAGPYEIWDGGPWNRMEVYRRVEE